MTPVRSTARRLLRPRSVGAGALALLLLTACAEDAPQDTFKPEGEYADTIANLNWVFWVAGVVGLVVFAAVVFTVVRYRERKGNDDDVPRQIHGNPKLEIMWTLAPAVLLAGVAVPTLSTVFELDQDPEGETVAINVIGNQWWWEFDYPELLGPDGQAIVTSGEMVIPAGVTAELTITSRDVIHSFWIPRLNGKRDAIPGRVHTLNMQADEPGEYWGQCSEYCGTSHANMRMRVVALSPEDWDVWVQNQFQPAAAPTDALALAGQESFVARCATCHQIDGLVNEDGEPLRPTNVPLVTGAAPNLTHLMSRTTFAGASYDLKVPGCTGDLGGLPTGTPVDCLNQTDLRTWLRAPEALKPMAAEPNQYSGQRGRGMPNLALTEPQIDELVAYLSTLK